MEELAREVINSLNNKIIGSEFVINGSNLESVSLNDANYNLLSDENSKDIYSELSFIDGGQTLFFDSPSIAIGLIRIGIVNYDGTQRISRNKNEFHILVKRNEHKFHVRTFPTSQFDNLELDFDKIKNSISAESGGGTACQAIISLIRRCFELEFASELKNPVLDGTLDAKSDLELKYVSKLTNTIAISKTCNFILNTGVSLTKRLAEKNGSWYYYPLFNDLSNKLSTNLNSKIYFAKLHDKSKYVFRIDFSKDISENKVYIKNLFYALKNLSNDPVFLGYPYGLIDVDQYARVSDEEKDYLRIKFSAKLGKQFKELNSEENSINAHQILDNIRF